MANLSTSPTLDIDNVAPQDVAHPDALKAIARAAENGSGSVVITGPVGSGKTTLLRQAAELLDHPPVQVIRIDTGGRPLTLPNLVATIAGPPGIGGDAADSAIERAHERMLWPSAPYARTFVMVDDAQELQHDALTYLQLATAGHLHAGAPLRYVFAGTADFWSLLQSPALKPLLGQISYRAELAEPAIEQETVAAPAEDVAMPVPHAIPQADFPTPPRVPGSWRPYGLASCLMATIMVVPLGSMTPRIGTVPRDAPLMTAPVSDGEASRTAADLPAQASSEPPPAQAAVVASSDAQPAPPAPEQAAAEPAASGSAPEAARESPPPEPALAADAVATPTEVAKQEVAQPDVAPGLEPASGIAGPAPTPEPETHAPAALAAGPAPPAPPADPPASVAEPIRTEPPPAATPTPQEAASPSIVAPVPPEPTPTIAPQHLDASGPGPTRSDAAVPSGGKIAAAAENADAATTAPPSGATTAPNSPPSAAASTTATITITTSPAAPPAPRPAVHPVTPLPPAVIAAIVRRGDGMLRLGAIEAARLLYARAAQAGDGAAALAAGRTHDPRFLRQIGALGIAPEPAQAAEWYRRAAALGNPDADRLLAGLGADRASDSSHRDNAP